IRTSHIKYRRIFLGSSDLAPFSPDEISTILAAADLDNKPEAVLEVAAKLCIRENLVKNLPSNEFFSDGVKTREDSDFAPGIFDGGGDVTPQYGERQIVVGRAAQSQRARLPLSRFRIIVPRSVASEARRTSSEVELDIDAGTQFVRRRAYGNRVSGSY